MRLSLTTLDEDSVLLNTALMGSYYKLLSKGENHT